MDERGDRLNGDRKRGPCKRARQQIANSSVQPPADQPVDFPDSDLTDDDEVVESAMEEVQAGEAMADESVANGEDQPMAALVGDGALLTGDEDKVWSAMVEIDAGFPFDLIWPEVRSSVCNALRGVHSKWPDMGWRSGAEMEECLRSSVEKDGVGAIARGLTKVEAEAVAQKLNGEMTCYVRVDQEGAAAAVASARSATASSDDTDRREKIRQRIQELREGDGGVQQLPMFADILDRLENDIDDDERWHSLAPAMEHMLDRMSARGTEVLRTLFGGGILVPMQKRTTTIIVERARPAASALWAILRATPEELRPGRLRIKYKGEEGEDGEGGGGVTRVFLTQVGKELGEPHFGLFLLGLGGHVQLSPRPGFLCPEGGEVDSVFSRPDCWSQLLGRLLGMSVVHECPLGILLAPSLCKQLLGKEVCFDDLQYVPGLNDGGAGWYSSLRAMLAHRAPQLVEDADGVVHMDSDTVNAALRDLDATMISKSQQVFESMATFVGSTAQTEPLWEGAVGVAACLLQQAHTEVQRNLAVTKSRALLAGIHACRQPAAELSPGLATALRAVAATESRYVSHGLDAANVFRLAGELLDLAPRQEKVSPPKHDWRRVSDLKPLRPTTIPPVTDWFTTGAKHLMRDDGKFYHEVELDEDFFDPAPQLGWHTEEFVEKDSDGNGVGDDEHGWAADGVRHKKWHDGHSVAQWPRAWKGGDVIGLAIDTESGDLKFSLNGDWVSNAAMSMTPKGRKFYPAVSMKGRFAFNIPKETWRYSPPSEDYEIWATGGCFTRPMSPPAVFETLSLDRQVSTVEGPGVESGLSESTLPAFAEAVLKQALFENLKPFLDKVVHEFSNVIRKSDRDSLTWKEVQDRISGQRLAPEALVQAWREKTSFQCCEEDSPTIVMWWRFLSTLSADDLLKCFSWCTGFAAAPITAWKFQIKMVDDIERLPTVNTCLTDDPSAANRGVKMPTLYLPAYDNFDAMCQRMEWAISGATSINLH